MKRNNFSFCFEKETADEVRKLPARMRSSIIGKILKICLPVIIKDGTIGIASDIKGMQKLLAEKLCKGETIEKEAVVIQNQEVSDTTISNEQKSKKVDKADTKPSYMEYGKKIV